MTTWISGPCSRAATRLLRDPRRAEGAHRGAARAAGSDPHGAWAGASIWSFTYDTKAGLGSPGYAASEPPTDARVFGLWNGLEGLDGTLYADGMVSYGNATPTSASPGTASTSCSIRRSTAPTSPSRLLRLENLRDGIEDADLARLVVGQRGRAALLAILARERIFSIRHGRLLLGCKMGCDLVTSTKYAWPRYRHGAGTAAALERVHTALLEALAPPPG